jgi:hypothetical protein
LWLPAGDGMLSISTTSLAASTVLVSLSVKRDTRFTGLVDELVGQVLPNLLNV